MTSVYLGHAPVTHTPRRTPAGSRFVLQGPWGARSRDWRPSRAGPFSHGQLLRSRRVSKGKTWTWNDPIKQSPPWVHRQATAPDPLTPKFYCSSIFFSFIFLGACFSNQTKQFSREVTLHTASSCFSSSLPSQQQHLCSRRLQIHLILYFFYKQKRTFRFVFWMFIHLDTHYR